MNRGISRLTSAQMRARAIAYEEAAHHLERGLDPKDEDSAQEDAAAKHLRRLAAMWSRRADKGPLPTKRRPKTFKPFMVRLNRPVNGMPEGSRILVKAKFRHLYVGDWSVGGGTVAVRVPKAACSIA